MRDSRVNTRGLTLRPFSAFRVPFCFLFYFSCTKKYVLLIEKLQKGILMISINQ